ncbi:ABC transporter G family member 21 isoform X2 [Daphnia magna]|uniref:ABC protein, subfamily ABCG n=1 Tax=Daphnia magna TaxID=35525 RepID=A0A164MFR0_9CRUS|nr:ABC transporter G family member 21 isoform X2 [Daphnia magna]KZS05021.1 ABC protein, subfamily ABCG [Daphnia magna]
MIISKDLFIFGEQDYLKLLRDSRKRDMGRPVTRTDGPTGKTRPMDLHFTGLSVSVGKRALLNEVSGVVQPGEILAVMGPSGSGKTTLLNAISGRLPLESGTIHLNGELLNKKLRRKICYVLQHDVFFPDLTLKQTLVYTALLRLPESMSYNDKMQHVNHIIEILDLQRCQDTIIGDGLRRGLSGGEKKRANIACELLTNPALLLLDEPTSGLDSSTAHSLMTTLKNYARQENKTVVLTVHQPSSQIFYMFDRLLLLCNGQTAYFGDTKKVVDFFKHIGLPIEPHYNPADFILEQVKGTAETQGRIITAYRETRSDPDLAEQLLMAVGVGGTTSTSTIYENYLDGLHASNLDPAQPPSPTADYTCQGNEWHLTSPSSPTRSVELRLTIEKGVPCVYNKITKEEEDSGRSSWSDNQSHASHSTQASSGCHSSPAEFHWDESTKWPTSFWTQFKVLSRRNFTVTRPRMLSRLNWIQTLGLGLMSGLLWFRVDRKEETLTNIQGWMFFSTTYWMLFALFGALSSFPSEQEVIKKERQSGAYRLSAYYMAKMVGELPLIITLPAVYHIISYPMLAVDFFSPGTFVIQLGFLLLNTVVAQSAGLFIGAACMDLEVSITISALYTLASQLFGGFLSTSIPAWMEWMRYFSLVHYAFQNMQIVEFNPNSPVRCAEKNSRFDACVNGANEIPPDAILAASGGTGFPLWANTLLLLSFLFVFRILGYMVLRYFRRPR